MMVQYGGGKQIDLLYTNVTGGVGPNLAASGASGQIDTAQYTLLGVFVTVKGAVSGTTPELNVVVDGIDGNGNAYFIGGTGTPIEATGGASYAIGPGTGNSFMIPAVSQVTWQISGADATFDDTEIYLYGQC